MEGKCIIKLYSLQMLLSKMLGKREFYKCTHGNLHAFWEVSDEVSGSFMKTLVKEHLFLSDLG